jgi:hypothetical protein
MTRRRKTKDLQPYHTLLHLAVAGCPHCGSEPGMPTGDTVIYRLSGRSVTFRCNRCTLQWTMTMHRISQMGAHYAARFPDGSFTRRLHEDLAHAFAVPEQRGRQPA